MFTFPNTTQTSGASQASLGDRGFVALGGGSICGKSAGVMKPPVLGSSLYAICEGVSPASQKRLVLLGQPVAKQVSGAYQGARKNGRQRLPAPAYPSKGVLVMEGQSVLAFPYGDRTQPCGRRKTLFANATYLVALL